MAFPAELAGGFLERDVMRLVRRTIVDLHGKSTLLDQRKTSPNKSENITAPEMNHRTKVANGFILLRRQGHW